MSILPCNSWKYIFRFVCLTALCIFPLFSYYTIIWILLSKNIKQSSGISNGERNGAALLQQKVEEEEEDSMSYDYYDDDWYSYSYSMCMSASNNVDVAYLGLNESEDSMSYDYDDDDWYSYSMSMSISNNNEEEEYLGRNSGAPTEDEDITKIY